MIQFKELEISDKSVIESFTMKSDRMGCDLSFSNLCGWKFLYNTHWATVGDFIVFKFHSDGKSYYTVPLGQGDVAGAILLLMKEAENRHERFFLCGISQTLKGRLEGLFPGKFTYRMNRDAADYVYLRHDLSTLTGAKFQPKRNHLNKFRKSYNYEYLDITPALIGQCLDFEAEWCRRRNCAGDETLVSERKSISYVLNHFEQLGLTGGALFVDSQMVAFTYGSPINASVFDINVEKAYADIDGAYPMINFEFANRIPEQFVYINREEDLGVEGLRKAKLSYHPVMMIEKGIAYIHADDK